MGAHKTKKDLMVSIWGRILKMKFFLA